MCWQLATSYQPLEPCRITLTDQIGEVVEVGRPVVVIHIPAGRSDEHVVLCPDHLGHEAVATQGGSGERTVKEPFPSVP